jgi:tetratricopeptide (TPR) repeat protein
MNTRPRPENAPIKRLKTLTFLVLALLPIAFLSFRKSAPQRALESARQAIAQERFEDVQGLLAPALASTSARPAAAILLAEAAVALDRPRIAVEVLESTTFSPADEPRADYWKGRILLRVGQFLRAYQWLKKCTSQMPDFADAWRWQAVAAYELGDREGAVKALGHVTRLNPGDARAWRTIGFMLKEDNAPDEALPAYKKALESPAAEPAWFFEAAQVAVDCGEIDTAEKWLGNASKTVDPADRDSLQALIEMRRGDTATAKKRLDSALTRSPDHPGLSVQMAAIRQQDGRLDDADRLLSQALKSQPTNAEWLFQRGMVRRLAGQKQASDEDLKEADRIRTLLKTMSELNSAAAANLQDPDIRIRLGRIAQELGMTSLAGDWYRAALACDPNAEVPTSYRQQASRSPGFGR